MKKVFIFFSAIFAAMPFISCNPDKTNPDPTPGPTETTYTIYCPYVDEQLEYVNDEFNYSIDGIKKPKIVLSKSTAVDDKDVDERVRKDFQTGIPDTTPVKVFKVCEVTLKTGQNLKMSLKVVPTGTYKQGSTFLSVFGGFATKCNRSIPKVIYEGTKTEKESVENFASIVSEIESYKNYINITKD